MKMTKPLNPYIEKIVNDTPYLPLAFKSIFHSDRFFVPGEEIIDCLCFEREGYDVKSNFIVKHKEWQPTTFIVATNYGITILVEGGSKISDTLFGYRMRHISYEHITAIELDVCFLDGKLSIMTGDISGDQAVVRFNTAKYYQECECFIETVRTKIFESHDYMGVKR